MKHDTNELAVDHRALSKQLQRDAYDAATMLRLVLLQIHRHEEAGAFTPTSYRAYIREAMNRLDMSHLIPFAEDETMPIDDEILNYMLGAKDE